MEISSHSSKIIPFWAKKQFSSKIFQVEDDSKLREQLVFLETVPTKSVELHPFGIFQNREKANIGEVYTEVLPANVSQLDLKGSNKTLRTKFL